MRHSAGWTVLAILLLAPIPLACEQAAQPAAGGSGETSSPVAVGLRVRAELLAKLGIDGLRIDVAAEGGNVRLGGEVKKRATAELAEEVARQVSGVSAVENQIHVSGTEETRLDQVVGEAEQELRDAALETKVHLALIDRMGRDGFRIGTDAASGVLSLEFPKDMQRARRREAIAIAEKVEGVSKVISLDRN